MRFAIGRIAANRLAQPENRRLRVFLGPIGVAEVEVVVRIVLVELERLIEVVGRAPGLRRHRPPQLDDANVVHAPSPTARDRRSVLNVANASSRRFSWISDSATLKRARAYIGEVSGMAAAVTQRSLSVALVMMHVPEREPRAIEAGIELDGGLEIAHLRRRRRRDEPLDVVLEHGQRRASRAECPTPAGPARRRLTRSKIAKRSSSGPASTNSCSICPVSSLMLCARTDIIRPSAGTIR